MRLAGHVWTIRPWLVQQVRPTLPPPSTAWTTVVSDARRGPVRLSGWHARRAAAREIVVVVHGLGGSSAAYYVAAAARAADRAGLDSLRLDLRGAPCDGEDLYNAGLTEDVRAAIASEALAPYDKVYVLGYSMGGHIALRYATEAIDPRVRAVAAVCPPVDLDRSASALDELERWVYRHHVLEGLKAMYRAVVARRADPALPSLAEVRAIDRLRTWDDRVVAPRYGFRSAEHYYAEASVAPRLGSLARPALLVAALSDPMIPPEVLRPALSQEYPLLDVRWLGEGGHVGFPNTIDLGLGGELGLEAQTMRWLRKAGSL
jgi:predicted alpha/beta-fold hydrolase